MPARSEWKGFLCINQLQVPVKAFSAASSEPDIALNQLHRGCGERIRQRRCCPVHGDVESEAIISGYQVSEHSYLPLNPEDLEQIRPEPDKAISVDCFIENDEIDPVYYSGKTYYLVPDGPPGQRPYTVLREGMQRSGRRAFCRVVVSRRELLVLLRPFGKLLAMTVVEYPQRVHPSTDYESDVTDFTPSENEVSLAKQLIDAMTNPTFDLHGYRDRYRDRLTALIEERLATTSLVSPASAAKEPQPETGDDDSLLAILQASLNAAGIGENTRLDRNQRFPVIPAEEQQHISRLA